MLSFRNFLLSAFCFSIMSMSAAVAETLTKEQISQQIVGKTLIANQMGMKINMIYKPDGTVTMKALLMSGSGTWSYNDNGICMLMTSGPRRGETCVTFEHLGGKKYLNSEGATLTVQD